MSHISPILVMQRPSLPGVSNDPHHRYSIDRNLFPQHAEAPVPNRPVPIGPEVDERMREIDAKVDAAVGNVFDRKHSQ